MKSYRGIHLNWASVWEVMFSIGKCKVMDTGTRNPNFKYMVMGSELVEVKTERYWGYRGQTDENVKHVLSNTEKANSGFSIIRKVIENKMTNIAISLCRAMV